MWEVKAERNENVSAGVAMGDPVVFAPGIREKYCKYDNAVETNSAIGGRSLDSTYSSRMPDCFAVCGTDGDMLNEWLTRGAGDPNPKPTDPPNPNDVVGEGRGG